LWGDKTRLKFRGRSHKRRESARGKVAQRGEGRLSHHYELEPKGFTERYLNKNKWRVGGNERAWCQVGRQGGTGKARDKHRKDQTNKKKIRAMNRTVS